MLNIVPRRVLERHVSSFNQNDHELYRQHISNDQVLAWMEQTVPRLECPDKDIEETYYFRWWTFRKHIKSTEDGFVITEFLPTVHWAGKHNSVSGSAGHNFREGRWLRDDVIFRDYALYWLRKGGTPRSYSFWIADSILSYSLVTGDKSFAVDLLPELVANFEAWEDHRDANGLYWQVDDRDGMEYSISGRLTPDHTGYRATINSYMFGDAMAISRLAEWAGNKQLTERYRAKAAEIKRLAEANLWDEEARFFKVLPRMDQPSLSDVRELHGYTPWYFNLPDADKSDAWSQLMDSHGFYAPFGPTTAEQRHPEFKISVEGHACQWNGPTWPFSTCITLTAMANLLNDYSQEVVSREDYYEMLKIYTRSHRLRLDDGREVRWIDENLNPFTGAWMVRDFKKTWQDGKADPAKKEDRGKDYNHSTYCDLIINGLIGIRPQEDDTIVINPLVPDTWDYFCLDGIPYHGRLVSVLFDRTGDKYGKGPGLRVFADGEEVFCGPCLSRIQVTI